MFSCFRFGSLKYQKGTFCKTPSHFPNERSFTFDAIEVAIKSASGQARPSAQRFPDWLKCTAPRELSCRLERERHTLQTYDRLVGFADGLAPRSPRRAVPAQVCSNAGHSTSTASRTWRVLFQNMPMCGTDPSHENSHKVDEFCFQCLYGCFKPKLKLQPSLDRFSIPVEA
jgi:hypothetical protein